MIDSLIQPDFVCEGPKKSARREPSRQPLEILALNRIEKVMTNLRAGRDLGERQPCLHTRLL